MTLVANKSPVPPSEWRRGGAGDSSLDSLASQSCYIDNLYINASTTRTDMFNIQKFEDSAKDNGIRYWIAHDYMANLGYESWNSFRLVIHKAISSCLQLGIDSNEAFIPFETPDGTKSYKLTRFACYLIAMQANPGKPEVVAAQVALAKIAEILVEEKIAESGIARIEERGKLTSAEKHLSGVAKSAGLEAGREFAIFKDFGIRGMYNMPLKDLQRHKGTPEGKTLYDFMGLTELAANTFRVTQTAERMKRLSSKGLEQAKRTAHEVGGEVREVMLRSSGIAPEDLKIEGHINQVKKQIKTANREMQKLDAPKKPTKSQKKQG